MVIINQNPKDFLNYFKDIYYAERPHSERLLTKKLNLRGVNKMRDWRISLKEYIDSMLLKNLYDKYITKIKINFKL